MRDISVGSILIGEIYCINLKFKFGFEYLFWILYIFFMFIFELFLFLHESIPQICWLYDTWRVEFHGLGGR